ncbi:MAG: hypothetical protein HC851_15160 [Acaryochloris sp. RU_4_1]|nr:hypothetical protein [Acaryochloris sp. RU_4_1]
MPNYDFVKQFEIGTQHERTLDEFFRQYYWIKQATRQEQRQGIDRWFHAPDGSSIAVEYKADRTAGRTGNAFIETISVDARAIQGWAYASQADALVYYVPPRKTVWLICFVELRRYLAEWLQHYPIRQIPNEDYCTHGLLVPLLLLGNIAFEVCHIGK